MTRKFGENIDPVTRSKPAGVYSRLAHFIPGVKLVGAIFRAVTPALALGYLGRYNVTKRFLSARCISKARAGFG